MALPKTPSFRLDGKKALVTGASSGIGAACAVALAEAGADVLAVARRADKLEELAKDCRDAGYRVTPVGLDVTDFDALGAFIADNGPFDVLLNSAGMARHGPALDARAEDFDAVVEVNLKSAYFQAQHVAKGLIAAGKPGSIITISSQMSVVGGIERSVYSATKAGVDGFTRGMAIEWGPHKIRINTICPTFVVTALTQASFDDPVKREWIESKIKLGRVGEVEDMMGAAVFLASDAAALITGTSMLVDGGWTAD
ncbi:MAG: SDR family oxidoreductase [Alphaproteobacteria bacterium]|nr:SDR family oxidoreductase [Alphaproteobacteria bacterium]